VNRARSPHKRGMSIICAMRILSAWVLPLTLSVTGMALGADETANPLTAAVNAPVPRIVADSTAAVTPVPGFSAQLPVADQVVVRKSERRLYLLRHGEVIRSYRVSLGLQPQGAKEHAGDFRTPEGHYQLTRRNSHSDYFLSILVSYPNADDARRARSHHEEPGGLIMIHGLPNNLRHSPDYYATADWTDGCIALSNSDMVEVWLMTQDNVRVEILP
jgi:L,D-transpeptidase catalytic domain